MGIVVAMGWCAASFRNRVVVTFSVPSNLLVLSAIAILVAPPGWCHSGVLSLAAFAISGFSAFGNIDQWRHHADVNFRFSRCSSLGRFGGAEEAPNDGRQISRYSGDDGSRWCGLADRTLMPTILFRWPHWPHLSRQYPYG